MPKTKVRRQINMNNKADRQVMGRQISRLIGAGRAQKLMNQTRSNRSKWKK